MTLGQGETVGDDPLMVFHDDSPIIINHVGFSSAAAATNDEWLVPDEFASGPGKSLSHITRLYVHASNPHRRVWA